MNYDENNNQNSNPNVVSNMTPNTNMNSTPVINNQVVIPANQSVNANIPVQTQVVNTIPTQVNMDQNSLVQQPVVNSNVQNSRVINNINEQSGGTTSINNGNSNDFIKGIFNFSNIKKLFKYDWSSLIEDLLPKNSKESIDKQSYDNIFYGGVLKIVADLLAIVFSICMVYVIDTLEPTRIDALRTLGLKNDVGITAFVPIIITLVIFTYNSAIGYQPQKTTFHFAFIWMIFFSTIFSLVRLVSYIATLFISPLYAILGFISLFLALLGNIHVVVGCIDFCKRVTKNYIIAHTVVPAQSAITTTRIDVDDVSDHNNKTCPYCAKQIPKSSTTCSFCGNNL